VKNVLKLPGALVGALRRNGVRNIAVFAGGMLRKRGLWGTARYALLTAAGRGDAIDTPPSITSPDAPAADRDLDSRYALPMAKWRERLRRMRDVQEAHAAPSLDQLPELGVVLMATPGAQASDLARTLESLAQLAASLSAPPSVFVADTRWSAPIQAGLRIVGSAEQLPGVADAWILYLGIGDLVPAHFVHAVAPAMRATAPLVITFDLFREEDGLAYPLLLPGANPFLARHVDYSFSRLMLRAGLTSRGAAVDQPRALLAAWLAARPSPEARSRWRHVFEPLVEARLSQAEIAAAIAPSAVVQVDVEPRVSLVVCTKDKGHLLRQLSRALLAQDARIADLVIVSNNTTSPHALETLRGLADHPKVKVLTHDAPFNFSRLSNLGAAAASGDFLLFLNDDIVPVSDDWLGALLAPFREDPAVGVTGPLLVYPDERVQHAGMYLGYQGIAGHTLRHSQSPQDDYLFYTTAPREVSALTGAAMLVSRACFDALNGFDELLATHLQDVDFSLRAKHSGFVNVFEPRAVLIHMESVSVQPIVAAEGKSHQRHRELQYFLARWGEVVAQDDLHNPAFAPNDETLHDLA
jgi:GT2 family glycosyltransferase